MLVSETLFRSQTTPSASDYRIGIKVRLFRVSESNALRLATLVQYLPGVGPSRAKRLQKLGVNTAQQILFFLPRSYELPAPVCAIDKIQEGVPCSLIGEVEDIDLITRSPGKSICNVIVINETGAVRLLFFNQPYRAEQLTIGQRLQVSGNPRLNGLQVEFTHPKVVTLSDEEDLPVPEILPVYSLTEGLKQTDLRKTVRMVVDELSDQLKEVMPQSLRIRAAQALRAAGVIDRDQLPGISDSIRGLHFPSDQRILDQSRARLIFQECLVLQLALAIRQKRLSTERKSPVLTSSAMIDARIKNRFPFPLTIDQERVIEEIQSDVARPFPMNRLLQGDVGSGKTVVAVYAMLLCVANRYQAVLMAPTEVLARQHYLTLKSYLAETKVTVGLLSGSLSNADRRQVLHDAETGQIDLLVGTQALLHGGVRFSQLGLCVVDEQHKFGVAQREMLRRGGADPHYLVMSATPIPRSIAMTLFGDAELSTLRGAPPGRGTVHTYLSHQGWKDRWWNFVCEKLNEGRQAYVVAPMIDSVASSSDAMDEAEMSKNEDISSVESVYEDLANGLLSDYRIGLLHGRMDQQQKQRVMEDFHSGKLQVLVSTTVIEVGIDVSNATVITILGAQKFGLAQLHQLRGRVSRGVHDGHVCVFTDGETHPDDHERLKVFESTHDGFELAEADFRLRGPGDFFGKSQSGLPPLRITDLHRDQEMMRVARRLAKESVEDEEFFESEDWAELRSQVLRRYGDRLDLGDLT